MSSPESEDSKSTPLETAPFLPGKPASREWKLPYLRYLIAVLGTFSCALAISCSFAYNFAVVCNVNGSVDTETIYNEDPSNSRVMHFPSATASIIYGMYPIGNISALFLMMLLAPKISMRNQVLVGTAISTLCTALIPMLYDQWPNSTLILKLIQGAAAAPTVPLIGHIAAHWTPFAEVGFIVAILSSYSQLGIFITMSLSGVMCTNFGWRSIFYFNAGCSGLVVVAWALLFRDRPGDHPLIADGEYQTIREHEAQEEQKKRARVPYRQFFSSLSVWAVLIAAIGNYNGISPLIVFGASVLKKAVGLSDIETSNYNGTSFALQLVFKLLSGRISDKWNISESFKTRFFNSISCGLCGVLMIFTAFLPVSDKVLCAVFITITQAIIGFNSAGFNKAAMIVTKQHAHYIVTIIGVIICASTIAEPFVIWRVAPESTWDQWFWLFIAHGGILIVSNIFFCIFITAAPADFTKQTSSNSLQSAN